MTGARTIVVAELDPISTTDTADVDREARLRRTACFGAVALALVAPFEALRPVLVLPGQSLTTVEAMLAVVALLVASSLLSARRLPVTDARDVTAWLLFLAVAASAALTASDYRANALHMTARFAMAFIVWVIVVTGAGSCRARRSMSTAVVCAAVAVSALVIADFANVTAVRSALLLFRDSVAEVGGQVRASGPFQYPTIASMYLEIAFALGLGLLVAGRHASARRRVGLVVALAFIAEGVVLTFTRSGLIATWLSLAAVTAVVWRRRGFDTTASALTVLAALMGAELFSSLPIDMIRLRLTSEGQARWFRAAIEAPASLELDTRSATEVMVTVTNAGRATWDSNSQDPIRLSYHWIADDSDAVVAWEGIRTQFAHPVQPGETVAVRALVKSPNRPGRFKLMWDLEQEHRRWFSTEPDAAVVFSRASVAGPVVAEAAPEKRVPTHVPTQVQRPGRRILWEAALRMWWQQPWFGVGPDNFRLLYGRYSSVAAADPRIHSNNMYVEVLAGMGLAGFAAMLWLGERFGRAALVAARTDGLGLGIAAACATCAIHGLVDSFLAFTGTYILMAIVAGLACAIRSDGVGHAHRI